jgi:hypothetical protein
LLAQTASDRRCHRAGEADEMLVLVGLVERLERVAALGDFVGTIWSRKAETEIPTDRFLARGFTAR